MSAPASARPTGITILSILAGLEGVFGLFSGFAVMGLGAVDLRRDGQRSSAWPVWPWARPVAGPRLGVLDGQAVGLALGVVLAASGIVLAVLTLIGANARSSTPSRSRSRPSSSTT